MTAQLYNYSASSPQLATAADSSPSGQQQYSRDDSSINSKEESQRSQIKCESSPPTPRALRLERVAAALAKSPEDMSVVR